jgi:hypothetical protein
MILTSIINNPSSGNPLMTASDNPIVISGAGLWTPEHSISNEELVEAYNGYAVKFNREHASAIESGEMTAKPLSSADSSPKHPGLKIATSMLRKVFLISIECALLSRHVLMMMYHNRPKWG